MTAIPGTKVMLAKDLPVKFEIATTHHEPVFIRSEKYRNAVVLHLCYGSKAILRPTDRVLVKV